MLYNIVETSQIKICNQIYIDIKRKFHESVSQSVSQLVS